jgi:3-oxoacyl-[acyl-carrier-protein] synthase II
MSTRIVITGAGVISSIGAGVDEFERAIYGGASGIGPSELFGDQTSAAEVRKFTPQQWLGNKGIRVLDRSARLLCVAAQMALCASRLLQQGETTEGDPELGLICGTMFGGLHSITSFDWSGLMDGPNYVNPMEFPNTVINSPAGQAAIKYKLRGINSTVCAGLASGLYALHCGAEFLRFGRARILLCGGVDEICEESILGFRKTDVTSPSGSLRPFSKGRDGTVLGEGSALLVLESSETAAARGASPWAEVSGFGCAHDAKDINAFQLRAGGATAAVEQALESAGIAPDEVGCIISGASGSRAGDEMEARALANIFKDRLGEIPVCAPKAALGEVMGVSGALCALVAAITLRKQTVPPTAGFAESEYGLRLSGEPQPMGGVCALVNAFGCDGNNAAMVLRRWSQ